MACFRLPRRRRARAGSSAQSKVTEEVFNAVFGEVGIKSDETTPLKTIRRVPKLNPLSLQLTNSRESVVESHNSDETTTMSMAATLLPAEKPDMKQKYLEEEIIDGQGLYGLEETDELPPDMCESDAATLLNLGIPFHSPVMGEFFFPYPPIHHPSEPRLEPGLLQNGNGTTKYFESHLNGIGRSVNGYERHNLIPPPSTEVSLLSLDREQTNSRGQLSSKSDDKNRVKGHTNGVLPRPSFLSASCSSNASLNGFADSLVPGCTAPTGSRHWRLTSSALMAYNSLRGPFLEAGRDIYSWAERCQNLDLPKVVTDEDEGAYDEILDDVNSLYFNEQPSPDDHPERKGVFFLPRAPYEHIHNSETHPVRGDLKPESLLSHDLPALHSGIPEIEHEHLRVDFEDWGYSDEGDYKIKEIPLSEEDEFAVSDNEGHPDDGRISPCTFRLFAQSCRRQRDTCQIIEQVLQHYQPTNLRLGTIKPAGVEHQAPRYPGQYYHFSSGSGYAHEDEDEAEIDLHRMAKAVTIEHWVFTGYWPKNSDGVICG